MLSCYSRPRTKIKVCLSAWNWKTPQGDVTEAFSRGTSATAEASWTKLDTFPKIHADPHSSMLGKSMFLWKKNMLSSMGVKLSRVRGRQPFQSTFRGDKVAHCTAGKWMSESNEMLGLRKCFLLSNFIEVLSAYKPGATSLCNKDDNKNNKAAVMCWMPSFYVL